MALDASYYQIACSRFEGARAVRILPTTHPSHRLHGHSFIARTRKKLKDSDVAEGSAILDEEQLLLERITSQLDYRYINEIIEIPTDENIARWLFERIDSDRLDLAGIQSTSNQGVDLDSSGQAHLWRKFRFEAAHQLPNVGPEHKCGRMHGHGFEVIIHAIQDISSQQMGMDYDLIATHWESVRKQISNKCLNDVPGLENPTSEAIARWIWDQLKADLPDLSWVTVFETAMAGCHFDGSSYNVWKEFHFESAVSQVTHGNRSLSLLGHSYKMRLHCSGPFDEHLGWAIDYADIKEAFGPVYTILDHNNLDETEGVNAGSPLEFLQWIWTKTSSALPILVRIDLFETPERGVVCTGGLDSPVLPT